MLITFAQRIDTNMVTSFDPIACKISDATESVKVPDFNHAVASVIKYLVLAIGSTFNCHNILQTRINHLDSISQQHRMIRHLTEQP